MKNFIFCALLILPAMAICQQSFKLALEDSWPPYADKNGEGISKKIIEKAFSYSGIKPNFFVMPYARVLKSVESGRMLGGANVTRQASTEALFHFGQEPILKAKASFFFRPESLLLKHSSIQELPEGLKIGLIEGYEYGNQYERMKGKFKEVRLVSQDQIIKMLVSGRIDCAIMFDEVAEHTMRSLKLNREVISKSFLNHTSDIYVAFTKDNPKSIDAAKKLDQGVRKLKADGTYEKLFQH